MFCAGLFRALAESRWLAQRPNMECAGDDISTLIGHLQEANFPTEGEQVKQVQPLLYDAVDQLERSLGSEEMELQQR